MLPPEGKSDYSQESKVLQNVLDVENFFLSAHYVLRHLHGDHNI